jgi:hypothetical protein
MTGNVSLKPRTVFRSIVAGWARGRNAPGLIRACRFGGCFGRLAWIPTTPNPRPVRFRWIARWARTAPGAFRFGIPARTRNGCPSFLAAAEYSRKIEVLVQVRYANLLAKTYKSLSHRQFQKGLGELEDNALAIPRLVALGHRVGYDPFGVNGNIVRCRRGLSHAENCVSILSRIPQRHMDRTLYKSLFAESVRLRNDLLSWIHLLRTRFAARSGRAH